MDKNYWWWAVSEVARTKEQAFKLAAKAYKKHLKQLKIMTTEELLKPRYKVIADYPDSHYELGSVLDRDWARYPEDDETKPAIWRISQFPHLFKKMSWWEEREESDMPEYLKYYEGEDLQFVLRVEKYKSHRDMKLFWSFEYLWENEPDIKRMSLTGWVPASLEEYEQYQQSQLK